MKKPKKWLFVIHPIMFAMFFILALYSANVAEVSPSAVAIPLFSAMGFALLLLLPAWLIFRNAGKAAIIVSIFLILFFSYGYVSNAVEGLGITYKVLWPIWCILIICSAYLVKRTRRDLHNLTVILNIVAIALVIVPTINIAANEIEAASQGITTTENGYDPGANTSKTDSLPDIYYIVLDRYASESTLKEVYDFDNSEFTDYLSNRGFYVASESRSNYPESPQSLASSLNMKYINYLSEELGEDYSDMDPLYDMLQDYEVWHFLKSEGYEFIHMGSWWEPTRKNEYADMNFNYWEIPEFSMTLYKTTMLYPIALENALLPQWVKAPLVQDFRMGQWNRVQYKFDKLAEIPDMKEPTFVFAHMLIPHNPFVFDRNGNYLTAEEVNNRSVEVNYIGQLVFANNRVMELIDELLSSSEIPPIIILQSDEGSYPGGQDKWIGEGEWEEAVGWEEATRAELREKVTILNAYYLPDVNRDVLYPSITPVNSFRLVFNLYFDTDFELLPDRSYAFYRDHPYKFFEITDMVNCD
ncbi:MAG TPA: hypothetical protein VMX96_06235 [Dehalococcoidia bacterium]|nr:hypothetical protein [Dehalococcoidia bacterium]